MGRLIGFACLGALVVACGGASSSPIGDSASGPDGGAASRAEAGTTQAAYTLDDVCERTAPKVCELRRPCCQASFGYDEAACLAQAKADCEKDVADARAGRMTFHPDRIDACIEKYRSVLDECFETVDLLYRAFDIAECRIFEGTLAPGAKCERDSECAKPSDPGAFVDCNDASKTCTATRLSSDGEACSFGDGSPGFCKKGLYCDIAIGTSNAGTCKKATAIGEDCRADEPLALECGLGAYCDEATGKCAPAKADGATCATAFECRSLACEKTCQPAKPLVDEDECK